MLCLLAIAAECHVSFSGRHFAKLSVCELAALFAMGLRWGSGGKNLPLVYSFFLVVKGKVKGNFWANFYLNKIFLVISRGRYV